MIQSSLGVTPRVAVGGEVEILVMPRAVCCTARAIRRTTAVYDRRRQALDRHAAYLVAAFVAGD
jgi:hypothetical protein